MQRLRQIHNRKLASRLWFSQGQRYFALIRFQRNCEPKWRICCREFTEIWAVELITFYEDGEMIRRRRCTRLATPGNEFVYAAIDNIENESMYEKFSKLTIQVFSRKTSMYTKSSTIYKWIWERELYKMSSQKTKFQVLFPIQLSILSTELKFSKILPVITK